MCFCLPLLPRAEDSLPDRLSLFLPFLVIDMVIASTLMLRHDDAEPDAGVASFKLLLFVLVDGWAMTVGSLVATYQVT